MVPLGTPQTNRITMDQPPIFIENSEDKPLARIPLSQLMKESRPVCPLCGRDLPIDTKEAVIDGGIYTVCKVQCVKKE